MLILSYRDNAERGATIILSNFGMFAGRFASLVIVPTQVAIIGAGSSRAWSPSRASRWFAASCRYR
jgi:hypothetical protein